LSSISSIVDCGLVDCANDTLGDAADAGAIVSGATVQDIVDALGADPSSVAFFLSFFYGDILLGDPETDLGDVTLGDILLALLLGSDLPWEQLPLDEMGCSVSPARRTHYHFVANTGANQPWVPWSRCNCPTLYVPGSSSSPLPDNNPAPAEL
jgi:hypothetical protein